MTDNRALHKRAANAYRTWAAATNTDRVWDELKTYEQVAWRNVVRNVSANPEPAKPGDQHAALAEYLNRHGVAVNWNAGYLHLTDGCDGRYLETDLSDTWKVVQWHE